MVVLVYRFLTVFNCMGGSALSVSQPSHGSSSDDDLLESVLTNEEDNDMLP